jgi:AcrR family transcriptional regulator
MVSQRRNAAEARVEPSEPARAANAIPEERILEAAYELLLAVGLGRLNMAEIARRADVSRATLYRRWPNVRAVLAALVTREFVELTRKVASDAGSGRQAVTNTVVRAAGELRTHPLLRKIIDVDPEFLLPYLFRRPGSSGDQQLLLLEGAIRAGQADGSIRDGEPRMLARSLMLTARSFVLSGPVFVPPSEFGALDAELSLLVDRYLSP